MASDDGDDFLREVELRWAAHHREHALHDEAHRREHEQTQTALDKAERQTAEALDKAEHTVSLRFDGVIKSSDLMRDQVIELQKSDVKGEGKSLGQGAVIAVIVGAVGFAATLLGIVIVVVNLVAGA